MYRDILCSAPGSGGYSLESNMALALELFISYWGAETYKRQFNLLGKAQNAVELGPSLGSQEGFLKENNSKINLEKQLIKFIAYLELKKTSKLRIQRKMSSPYKYLKTKTTPTKNTKNLVVQYYNLSP